MIERLGIMEQSVQHLTSMFILGLDSFRENLSRSRTSCLPPKTTRADTAAVLEGIPGRLRALDVEPANPKDLLPASD